MTRNVNPADALEDEAKAHRARLRSSLSELRERATPAGLTQTLSSYARENGGAIMSSLGAQARDNPLSFLLIGAGLALWAGRAFRQDGYQGGMSLYRDDSAGDLIRRTADPTAGFGHEDDEYRPASRSGSGLRGVTDKISSATDQLASQASSIRDTVVDSYESTTDAVTSRAADLRDRASLGYEQARDSLSDISDRANDYTGRARSGLSTLASEQPLVLGALGLLAGAAIAAMLPRTRIEGEYLGDTAERLRSEARQMAGDTYERAKSAAVHAAEKATEVAKEEFAASGDHKDDGDKAPTGGPSSTGGTSSAGAASLSVGSGGARPTESIAKVDERSKS